MFVTQGLGIGLTTLISGSDTVDPDVEVSAAVCCVDNLLLNIVAVVGTCSIDTSELDPVVDAVIKTQ